MWNTYYVYCKYYNKSQLQNLFVYKNASVKKSIAGYLQSNIYLQEIFPVIYRRF